MTSFQAHMHTVLQQSVRERTNGLIRARNQRVIEKACNCKWKQATQQLLSGHKDFTYRHAVIASKLCEHKGVSPNTLVRHNAMHKSACRYTSGVFISDGNACSSKQYVQSDLQRVQEYNTGARSSNRVCQDWAIEALGRNNSNKQGRMWDFVPTHLHMQGEASRGQEQQRANVQVKNAA